MLENCSIRFLSTDALEADKDFSLLSSQENRLFPILAISGVQAPLWVWEDKPSRFILVDGYARWSWAKESGSTVLPCLVFPASVSRDELVKARVFVKICEPDLSLEEKAGVIERLLRFYPAGEVERKFLPLIGLPSKPGFSELLLAFLKTPTNFRKAVTEGIIDEKVALRLATWDESSRDVMLSLLKKLRCSVSMQREILDYVEDIGRLRGISFAEVLNQPDVVSVMDSGLLAKEKVEQLRRCLRSRLFPYLTAKEERFRQFMESLELPSGLELKPPEQFEGDEWEVRIRFSKPLEFLEKTEMLRRKLTSDALEKLLYGD